MRRNHGPFPKIIHGISPLGGNSLDGATKEGVPLFWDDRVQSYISELAIDDLNDRDTSLIQTQWYDREEEFRKNSGVREA